MYLKLEDEMLKRIQGITLTDYGEKLGYVPAESVTEIIADLLLEIDRISEKLTDFEKEVEENYELKHRNLYSEYGIGERDFY